MKLSFARAKAILGAIAAAAASIAGLDVTGFVSVMPPEVARWLVIIPSSAAVIVHIAEAIDAHLKKIEADHLAAMRADYLQPPSPKPKP